MKFIIRICALTFISFLFVNSYEVYSADQDISQTVAKLKSFETQLSAVEKSQTSILSTQDQIIDEIKSLKIWVNKHRGGKKS